MRYQNPFENTSVNARPTTKKHDDKYTAVFKNAFICTGMKKNRYYLIRICYKICKIFLNNVMNLSYVKIEY